MCALILLPNDNYKEKLVKPNDLKKHSYKNKIRQTGMSSFWKKKKSLV